MADEMSLKVALRRLRRDIDAVFGDGFAAENPVLVAAALLTASAAVKKPWVPVGQEGRMSL